jgi:hypothetical protein
MATQDLQQRGASMAHVDGASVQELEGVPKSFDGQGGAEDHLRRWVGLSGLILVVVLLVSIFATPEPPDLTASPAKVAAFVHDHRNGLYLNAYLTSLAVLIGMVFFWYLREVVSLSARGRRVANIGFAGGLLFLVGGMYAAGVSFTMADIAKDVSPSALQTLNIFAQGVNSFSGAATALLMGATSIAILQSKALPGWLAYVGLVLATASFAIPFLDLPAVGLWLLITSIVVVSTSKVPRTTTGG